MTDATDDQDEYGEEEYEAESPVTGAALGSPAEPSPPPVAPLSSFSLALNGEYESDGGHLDAETVDTRRSSPAQAASKQRTLLLDDDDDESGGDVDAGSPPRRSATAVSPPAGRTTGRHLLDNSAWTYAIEAARVRALKVPVAGSVTLRELRVFAVIDKQARQSRRSQWKADTVQAARRPSLLSTGSSRSLASVASTERGKKRNSISSPGKRLGAVGGRRSGLLEEAKWPPGDGKLAWTLPMERFRQLKAYNPRIKVFLYGIDEIATGNSGGVGSVRSSRLARESEAANILSLGWFFLDLRTPDLPSRWIKLQNARYGGEIQIRSSLSPFAAPGSPSSGDSSTKKRLNLTRGRDKQAALRPAEVTATRPVEASVESTQQPLPQEIITDDAGDFLQLGARNGTDVFIVSVAINGARDLASLVRRALRESDPTEVSAAAAAGFWLSYSLFDVVVQTDVFHNLDAAEFPPIRDSFRVRSCIADLRAFIEASHGGLPVFLCTKNQIVAGVTVPLSDLLDNALFAREHNERMPQPGTVASICERFLFPECDEASVFASVAIEYVGPAVALLGSEDRDKSDGEVVASLPQPIETHDDRAVEPAAGTTPSSTLQPAPTLVATVSVTHVRLANALLSPLVGSDGVTASVTLTGKRASESLKFCGFEKEFTTARLRRCAVVGTIDVSDSSTGSCRVQFAATASKRCLGEATIDLSEVIDNGKDAGDRTQSVPLRDEAGGPVGECVLRFRTSRGTNGEDIARDSGDEELDALSEQRRRHRLSLQVKAIRDVEAAGTYTIAFEHPFHEGIRARSQPLAVPEKRETSVRDLAYCVSERPASLSEIEQVMSGTVAIELAPIGSRESSEGGGVAAFSLNYLFYSEERFSCPEADCRETFPVDEDAAVHWREVHSTDESDQGYASTSIKSCSIYVPVIRSSKHVRGKKHKHADSLQTGQRVGMVRVDAALEDFGPYEPARSDRAAQSRLVPQLRVLPSQHSDALVSTPTRLERDARQSGVSRRNTSSTPAYDAPVQDAATPDTSPSLVRPQPSPEVLAKMIADNEHEQAWELALQAREWKKQFAEAERARMDELEHEWARREEERAELMRAAQLEYERLELKLRDALVDVEARERRLSVAEEALEREQRAHRDEMEALRKRLTSDQSHVVSLATQERDALAQRVSHLQSQVAEAQQRAREVERDYAEYRRQQRKVPEARLREEIAALRGSIAELERQKMAEERAKLEANDAAARLRVQLERANLQVQEERRKHETHVVEELEKLRLKYIAREEKYVLDGDREELRAIKRQLDELRGIHERTGVAATDSGLGGADAATRPVNRRKRSTVKTSRSLQQQQTQRAAQFQRGSEDSDDRIEYHGISSPGRRLSDRNEDQPSQRSSRAFSAWEEASLEHDGGRRGTHSPIGDSRAVSQGSSSVDSSDGDYVGTPEFSDGDEFDNGDLEDYPPSRSENDAPRQPQHLLTPSVAIASIASATMDATSGGGGASVGSAEQELKRLQRERELLLSSGTYTSKSYLVRELDRLIAIARGKMRL